MCVVADRTLLKLSEVRDMAVVSAVVLFVLFTCPCIILSLYTVISEHFKTTYVDIPQHLMIGLMVAGLLLMTFLPTLDRADQFDMTDTHARRRFYHMCASLSGIAIFYTEGSIFNINHIIAEFDCLTTWSNCENGYIIRYHITDLVFHLVRLIFMGSECVVCVVLAFYTLPHNALVMYSVAIIQSANIAICFQTIVSESYAHHHNTSLEINLLSTSCWTQEHNNSWSDCPISSSNHTTDCCWPLDNHLLRWLESSNPLLYPIVIEFSLLVGEVMLGKLYKGQQTKDNGGNTTANEDAVQGDGQEAVDGRPSCNDANGVTDGTPDDHHNITDTLLLSTLCHLIRSLRRPLKRRLFFLLVVLPVVNVLFFILFVYVGGVTLNVLNKPIIDIHEYSLMLVGSLLAVICTAVGLYVTSRHPFRHSPEHISSLDYLTLFCSAGAFLLTMKRMIVSIFINESVVYIIAPLFTVVQLVLQVVFLYRAKDVDLEPAAATSQDRNRLWTKVKIYVFMFVMCFMCVFNLSVWSAESVSPPKIKMEPVEWKTFNNIVGPVNIFFRFSSTLLFASEILYFYRSIVSRLRSSESRQERETMNVHPDNLTSDIPLQDISAPDQAVLNVASEDAAGLHQ